MRTNLTGLRAGRYLNLNQGGLSRALERLSSGLRINRAGDDAAGLAVSEKLRAQVSGLAVDVENAEAGISIVQTADQALQQVQAMVRRIRDLSLVCANDTQTNGDREHFQSEVDHLLTEIDRINKTTEYNGMRVLGNSIGSWAVESADARDILDGSSLRATDDLVMSGEYQLEVLRTAERAKAQLTGKIFDVTDPPLTIAEAGGFYRFAGANQDGAVTLKVTVDGKEVFVDIDAREEAGDSITEVMHKIDVALSAAGINAVSSYKPPSSVSDIIVNTSGILEEPLGTTVPVTWQNPTPTNWVRNAPKIYDSGGATPGDTAITIDFTSSTNFDVTGNVSGALGSGTTGTNFIGGGVSFKLQPDVDYAAGDRIVIAPSGRSISVNTPIQTGMVLLNIPMNSTIADGNHSITVANTSSVTGWNFVSTPGVAAPSWSSSPSLAGVNTIVFETFTLQMVADNGGPNDRWTVTGSTTGAHNDYTVGAPYTTNAGAGGNGAGLSFQLNPDAGYAVGDRITINTLYGRRATLDADSTPTDVRPHQWWTITDDAGSHIRVKYGSFCNPGTDTLNISTNLTTDTKHPPDRYWDVGPFFPPGGGDLVSQRYVLTLTNDTDGADVWSVTGTFSGVHNSAVAGTPYVSNDGTNGSGGGLSFTIAQDSKFHVGSTMLVDIYTKPSIEIISNDYGSKYEIDLEIVNDSINSSLTAYSSGDIYDGTTISPIGLDTIIDDNNGTYFDDLGFSAGTIIITGKAGNSYSVTVSQMDTIQDLIDSINALPSNLSAAFDGDERKLVITDSSDGNRKLSIADVGNATLAEDLGIRGEVSGDTLTGHKISRVADAMLRLTAPDDTTATVSGAWVTGDGHFAAVESTDFAVTDSSPENQGGIAGISFGLNHKQLKEGDTFSILAGKGTLNLQVSQSTGDAGRASVDIGDVSTGALGLDDDVHLDSQEAAQALIDSGKLDDALDTLSSLRGGLGAFQNRLEHTIKNLGNTRENLQLAESRIRDADMAREHIEFMKRQIMQQFGTATASQANTLAENVLRLLQ